MCISETQQRRFPWRFSLTLFSACELLACFVPVALQQGWMKFSQTRCIVIIRCLFLSLPNNDRILLLKMCRSVSMFTLELYSKFVFFFSLAKLPSPTTWTIKRVSVWVCIYNSLLQPVCHMWQISDGVFKWQPLICGVMRLCSQTSRADNSVLKIRWKSTQYALRPAHVLHCWTVCCLVVSTSESEQMFSHCVLKMWRQSNQNSHRTFVRSAAPQTVGCWSVSVWAVNVPSLASVVFMHVLRQVNMVSWRHHVTFTNTDPSPVFTPDPKSCQSEQGGSFHFLFLSQCLMGSVVFTDVILFFWGLPSVVTLSCTICLLM